MDIKVSVVIPVYNAEKLLPKCLDSVCGQTYTNLEILLINDGSKDGSLDICNEYAARDSRIVVHTQKNSGPSVARNQGIDMATGDYLAFVDSDDYVELNMVETMVNAAAADDADMVICNLIDEDGQRMEKRKFSYRNGLYQADECRKVAVKLINDTGKAAIPPYSPIRLVRRAVFNQEPKLRYNKDIKRSEDYLLWMQVYFRIRSMVLLGDAHLYHYVNAPGSITRSYLPGYWEMCKALYVDLGEHLPQDKEIKKNLQAMLINRALIALRNTRLAEKAVGDADFQAILRDKTLIRAAWQAGLTRNSNRAKVFAALVILRQRKLIKKLLFKG